MLCPRCGKDVGEMSRLCETCSQNEEASPEGSEIGRIRVERVARKVTPEEREALLRQREEYYSGKVVRDTAEILQELEEGPNNRLLGWSIFLLAGAGFLAWFIFWTVGSPESVLFMLEEQRPQEKVVADFSHIRIPEGRGQVEMPEGTIGTITVNDSNLTFLSKAHAEYQPTRDLVKVQFFSFADPLSPALTLSLSLKPGSKTLSSETLKGYSVELTAEEQPLLFGGNYSRQLTPFTEVGRLFGSLVPGEVIRGSFSNRHTVAAEKTLEVEWVLNFDTELASITEID